MRIVTLVARLLLGLVFVASGVAFFFTTPPPLEGPLGEFFEGMEATRYFFLLLKGTEIACGLALLTGFFVPLALVVLAPIILNIFLVHAFMAPEGLPLAIVVGVLEVYLAFFSPQYSPPIRRLFRAR
jgi:putative oxidoreductase